METFIENKDMRDYVTKLLLEDLHNLGMSDLEGYSIDWSNALGEGGGATYQDQYLESASDVAVVDATKKFVCAGWIDHIVDAKGTLLSYWTSVTPANLDFRVSISEGVGIPKRVWDVLDEQDKFHLAETHQGWSQDKNLLPYRRTVIPKQIEKYSKDVETLSTQLPTLSVPGQFDLNLYRKEAQKLLKLARKFLSGEALDPNISTETYLLQQQLWDVEEGTNHANLESVKKILKSLMNLEYAVRHAAIAIKKL